ncbi:MAG: hypothetical protein DRI57_02420 [Deltaproteobacteria bacterium]|nr:MAG: hypothetical protein DRI57_02420 [Deltaproteobacteria bacterium]
MSEPDAGRNVSDIPGHFATPRRGINPPAESQRMLKQPVPIFHYSLFIISKSEKFVVPPSGGFCENRYLGH